MFKIGDRVIVVDRNKIDDAPRGLVDDLTGTVKGIDPRYKVEQSLLIEFDEDIGGHSGNGIVDGVSGKSGQCWWMSGDGLKLITPKIPDVPLGTWEVNL